MAAPSSSSLFDDDSPTDRGTGWRAKDHLKLGDWDRIMARRYGMTWDQYRSRMHTQHAQYERFIRRLRKRIGE